MLENVGGSAHDALVWVGTSLATADEAAAAGWRSTELVVPAPVADGAR
jgi:hypothetical protein